MIRGFVPIERGYDREDRREGNCRFRSDGPLRVAKIRGTEHADPTIAPGLLQHPVVRVRAIATFVDIGVPNSSGMSRASTILYDDSISQRRQVAPKSLGYGSSERE